MRILGIETSCDETAAAVIEAEIGNGKVKILSNVVSSSLAFHQKTGGIIPEVAAREQVKDIIPVIWETLRSTRGVDAQNPAGLISAIAVTVGPGLVGSLLVGVETAKTLSYVWNKPIIPVNHSVGHIYANFLNSTRGVDAQNFPALAIIVSGGHTDLVLMNKHQDLKWLGGTRDDAAGEAFDKVARLLGFGYPGGPAIAAAAAKFKISKACILTNYENLKFRIVLPRPMINEDNFDFSFSGLKAAVFREVQKSKNSQQLAFETQEAIVDVLVAKTLRAAKKLKVRSILLSGGVAANELLRRRLRARSFELGVKFFVPAKNLCTDNAAMIATAAFFNYRPFPWQRIKVNPSLHFAE